MNNELEEDGIESNFQASYRTRETADLFLLLITHLLKEGGRSAADCLLKYIF